MTKQDLEKSRSSVVDCLFSDFNFNLSPEERGDWTSVGDEWSCVVYLPSEEDEQPTSIGSFGVIFYPESNIPKDVWSLNMHGDINGYPQSMIVDGVETIFPKNKELFVLVGPSGSGKTTMSGYMEQAGASRVVSTTTRPAREGEENGKSYFFLSREQFESKKKNGDFVEYAEFNGNYYGLSKEAIVDAIMNADNGKAVAIVEIQGWHSLQSSFLRPIMHGVFMDLPIEKLMDNLHARSSSTKETPEQLQARSALLNEERSNIRFFSGDREFILSNLTLDEMKDKAKRFVTPGKSPGLSF